jgi:hypothetical protein
MSDSDTKKILEALRSRFDLENAVVIPLQHEEGPMPDRHGNLSVIYSIESAQGEILPVVRSTHGFLIAVRGGFL